jgi:hypothetical protein
MTLVELCGSQLEQHVERLFAAERLKAVVAGKKYAIAPYIDDQFPVHCEPLFPHYKRMMVAALSARKKFRETGPLWAPELPLASSEYEKMIRDKDSRIALVGFFANSLACANWSKFHPLFYVYAAGAMECPDTPEHIRNDPQLRKEFPLCELQELDENLCWGAFDRTLEFTQQFMRRTEHLFHCGMLEEAARMEDIIKRITGIHEIYPD